MVDRIIIKVAGFKDRPEILKGLGFGSNYTAVIDPEIDPEKKNALSIENYSIIFVYSSPMTFF